MEEVGFADPVKKKRTLNAERIKYWISKGAQPSDSIHNLLISEKIIEGKKIDVHNKKKVKEGPSTSSGQAPVAAAQGGTATAVAAKAADLSAEASAKAEAPKVEVKQEMPKEPFDATQGKEPKVAAPAEEKKIEPPVAEQKIEAPKEPSSAETTAGKESKKEEKNS